MNILQAIRDANLFRPFLGDDLSSWAPWEVALRALYGLPVQSDKSHQLAEICTGRSASELPSEGFSTALFLVGRRSGKSKISAVIGAYEALFGGHERRLSKGESGVIPIISPSRYQSTVVWNYLRALFDAPLLQQEVVGEKTGRTSQFLKLRNNLEIRILTGDYRMVRGPAVVCAILDEICFFGYTEESKVKSDTELVRALRPALLTTKGKLIGISSKYACRGYAYSAWKRYHGANNGDAQFCPVWRTLVWDAPSRTMNPTLSEAEIAREYDEDPAAARSEFGGEWREDVAAFVPRALIEALVVPGRFELLPRTATDYRAGADLSGGRSDAAALVIAHKENGKLVQDCARVWTAPYNPFAVVADMAATLRRFRLSRVVGDAYAGEWPVAAFQQHGVKYRLAERSKNELYAELLPLLCGGRHFIELLDNPLQTNQLASLERRARTGGNDVIDHPRNGHDDVANALAVAADAAGIVKKRIGAAWPVAEQPKTLLKIATYGHH
ncbi:MAG: hypothetical protein AB9869_32810 [Verrucomicrobiia bacterium]